MRRSLAISLITFLFVAANAFAVGEARMTGKILDAATKQPIPGAVMKLEAVSGKTVKSEVKSRKDGSFTVMMLDGTLKYKFTITADGYAPYEETIKMSIGDTNLRDFELSKPTAQQVQQQQVQLQEAKADPAVAAYNDGAGLMNSGDVKGAIAKFEEAVAAKPDLLAGWLALAKANVRTQNWAKAIDAAKKGLAIDSEESDFWVVLHQAYTASGDKANAAIAEKNLPASATTLFNQAARLINDGKDSEAESALKKAIEMDAKYAQAHYELGMVYVRAGKSAEAKAALNKYLELEPNGKDAATAKEMLGYLN
jgi:tetratricopeptide (TPR) repeat protein